jgi:alkylation response protein AidB-like acyl-CoA dehydrogenase
MTAAAPLIDDGQLALRESVRLCLKRYSTESDVRQAMPTEAGIDMRLWERLSAELGVTGLAVPEYYGGAGAGMIEVGIVLEELGRSLACVPYLSSVLLAQSLLLHCGDESAARHWLPLLASGEHRAAVAVLERSGRWSPSQIATTATSTDAGWRLTGTKMFVVDGHTADTVFVAARCGEDIGIFAVAGDEPSLLRTAQPTIDLTRKQARLDLADTPAELIGDPASGWDAVMAMLRLAATGLSAESLGGAQHALEMAVDYAKVRVQFGRPIGSFQAIKHKCADMLLGVDSARAVVYHALSAAQDDDADLACWASLTHAYCHEVYLDCAAENIQVHGGIGFTWEHPAQLYFKRAQSNRVILGDPVFHRALAARQVGI